MSEPKRSARPLPEDDTARRIAWDRVLVWFMRTVAAMWMVKALVSWAMILGVDILDLPPFETMPAFLKGAVILFAVLDPVAAVGLWLTSAWGGVMWLIAVLSHLAVAVLRPSGATIGLALAVVEGLLIALYVTLSWLAGRDD